MGDVDLRRWRRTRLPDSVILRAPDGIGQVRIRPRFDGDYSDVLVGRDRIKLVTDEGELACAAVSRLEGRVVVTAVAGGDPLFCIDAIGVDPSIVVELIRRCGSGLGPHRRRMFEYTPPTGWHGIRRESESRWLHPDYPRLRSIITVFDARPMTDTPSERRDRLLYTRMDDDRAIETSQEPKSIESSYDLHGRIRSARAVDTDGDPLTRRAAAFCDRRYLYQASQEAPTDDFGSLRTFDTLLRSFRPLPQPTTLSTTSALSYCAD